jgi:hypothetical protein
MTIGRAVEQDGKQVERECVCVCVRERKTTEAAKVNEGKLSENRIQKYTSLRLLNKSSSPSA